MPDLYSDAEAPWDLLAKHLAGEASASEQQELHAWVTATPDRLPLLTAATRAWERGGTVAEEFSEADVEVAWQQFRVAADLAPAPAAAPAPVVTEGKVVPLWPAAQPWLRVAAAVLLLVGVWSLLRVFLPPSQLQMVTVTAGAERQQTTLPDGSKVWVNRHSTLSYAANFNEKVREVQLQGEAFFEVKKDQGRPFTVLANETRTQVLGTSFNVRAYGAEDSVEVAVVTGRVAFSPVRRLETGSDSVLLTAGPAGRYSSSGAYGRRAKTHCRSQLPRLATAGAGVRQPIAGPANPDADPLLRHARDAGQPGPRQLPFHWQFCPRQPAPGAARGKLIGQPHGNPIGYRLYT